jgi:hypothetical protein
MKYKTYFFLKSYASIIHWHDSIEMQSKFKDNKNSVTFAEDFRKGDKMYASAKGYWIFIKTR